jgi:hypothetical protein
MDINHLLKREQIERMRADGAACARSRAAHEARASGYRRTLEHYRRLVLGEAAFRPMTAPRPL